MVQEEKRDYNLKDDDVVYPSSITFSNFKEYIADFVDIGPTKFTPEFVEEFEGALDSARSTISDSFIKSESVKHTSAIDKIKSETLGVLNKLEYHVEGAFINEEHIIKSFHLNKARDLSHHTSSFSGYLDDVVVIIIKHKEALITEGMKESVIQTLSEAINGIRKHVDLRHKVKIDRAVATQDRIRKMNHLWSFLVKLKNAAKHIFEDQPEIRALFDLPKPKSPSDSYNSDEDEHDTDE